jgi:hypothetical protein
MCEEMKKKSGFAWWLSRLTELLIFNTSSEQFWLHRCLRPPEVGKETAYFSLGFNLAKFKSL